MPVTFQGGRLAPVRTKPRLKLRPYLAVPTAPPASVDWHSRVEAWPLYGNDTIGDCVIEGTLVSAPTASRGYRAAYSGPVVKLMFESGKHLTVTPNHAVLTPDGFRRARFLEEGDYAVGACRTKPLGSRSDIHFDQSPAPVEQVVASLARRGARTGVVAKLSVPVSAVDFHGDERFMNCDVDVVRADSLLERELDASLGKPNCQGQIGAASKLKRHLHGLGSPLKRRRVRGSSSLRGVGRLGERFAFRLGHSGVAEADVLAERARGNTRLAQQADESPRVNASFLCKGDGALAVLVAPEEVVQVEGGVLGSPVCLNGGLPASDLVASITQPSSEGGATDAEFAANLLQRHSGLVEADRVVDVQRQWFSGHVYDLSTDTRWYVANGILTHNCTAAMVGHNLQNTSTYGDGAMVTVPEDDVIAAYSRVSGYRPGHPETDRGAVLQDVYADWRKNGMAGHRALAFAEVEPSDITEVKTAINTFGAVGVGMVVTETMMNDFNTGRGWARTGGRPLGGHAVVAVGYDADGLDIVTWGEVIRMSWSVWRRTVDEAWIAVLPEWINDVSNVSPLGVDLYGLGEAMVALTGDGPNPFRPDPAPRPVPPGPVPRPDAADVALAHAVKTWLAARDL